MWTAAADDDTSKGIHAAGGGKAKGSTISQVEKAYPTAKCPDPIPPASLGPFACTLASHYHGRKTITLFTFYPPLKNGVSEIEIDYASPHTS